MPTTKSLGGYEGAIEVVESVNVSLNIDGKGAKYLQVGFLDKKLATILRKVALSRFVF